MLKEETVIPLGIGFVFVEGGEKAVTMATGCGMRRIRRRILCEREDSVVVSCVVEGVCGLGRLDGVDEKGRQRHVDVDGG